MKTITHLTFVILSFYSINIYSCKDTSDILESHQQTLKRLEINEISSIAYFLFKKASEGKLSREMSSYFLDNINLIPLFKKISDKAEKLSKSICEISDHKPRRRDDEVDAVRHFIWATYMSLIFGEKVATEIQSLQENKNQLDKTVLMDLYNNNLGNIFAPSLYRYKFLRYSKMEAIIDKEIESEVKKLLKKDEFFILETQKSKCQSIRLSSHI